MLMRSGNVMISVISVTYNNLSGLKKTVDSFISQGVNSCELIIVDGSSNDGTREFLAQIESPNIRFISEEDEGIYDAMNKGIKLAKYNFVVFMNAGDIFYNNNCLNTIKKIVLEDAVYCFDNVCITESGVSKKISSQLNNYFEMPTSHQSIIFPMIKNLQYDLSYSLASDFDLVNRLRNDSIKFISFPLPLSITEGGGISDKKWLKCLLEKRDINSRHNSFLLANLNFTVNLIKCLLRAFIRKALSKRMLKFIKKKFS